MNRIIVLVDMDCFYCQVEAKINPSLRGKPVAVAQYTELKVLGRIIAVNYEAKGNGVKRHMLAAEAKKICPDLEVVGITQARGKADLNKYRDASKLISDVLMEFCPHIEKASVDEAYLDITEIISNQIVETAAPAPTVTEDRLYNTYVVGYEDESRKSAGVKELLYDAYHSELKDNNLLHLALGASFVQQIREAIYNKTEFRCSAGISHNKILAKIACGLHKPNCQTILPYSGVPVLYKTLPVKKVWSLGGQFGDLVMKELNCNVMADVANYSLKELEKKFPHKTAQWLFEISHGIDLTPVKYRMISNSISCCKQFPGQSALKTKKDVFYWINELAIELKGRLDKDVTTNKRRGTLLTVRYRHNERSSTVLSKSVQLPSYDAEKIIQLTEKLLLQLNKSSSPNLWLPAFSFLGICVTKFSYHNNDNSIRNFMKPKTDECFGNQQMSCVNADDDNLDEPKSKNRPSSDDSNPSASFFLRYFKQKDDNSNNNGTGDNVRVGQFHDVVIDDIEQSDEKDATIITDDRFDGGICSMDIAQTSEDVVLFDDQLNDLSGDGTANIASISNPNLIDKRDDYNEDGSNISNDYFNIASNSTESLYYPEDFYENCPYCNKRVPVVQFESHVDHHVALELDRQLNSAPLTIVMKNDNRTTTASKKSNDCSKKRKCNVKINSATEEKAKGILSFFRVRSENKK